MKFALSVVTAFLASPSMAFMPLSQHNFAAVPTSPPTTTVLKGYLDDLSAELRAPDSNPDLLAESREANQAKEEQVDRFGVGDWGTYVEFTEFDGGDGQMGVAGDGKKGLEKEWTNSAQMAKSKFMSAKNAWGSSTGYADALIEQGMEQTRAQQLENWQNQQEVLAQRRQQRFMTEQFDKVSNDDDWRKLSSFGVERTQDFDLDTEFGAVVPGQKLEGVIELTSRLNQAQVFEFSLKNPFMGFSDFRARFTSNTGPGWTVEPTEGSLNGRGAPTEFKVKFRAQNPGVSEGYLVVETDEEKWTWQLLGRGSM